MILNEAWWIQYKYHTNISTSDFSTFRNIIGKRAIKDNREPPSKKKGGKSVPNYSGREYVSMTAEFEGPVLCFFNCQKIRIAREKAQI